ncbi:MAG: tetratricopeptide repeat protein [Acetobacteraceae bacterium]|nr:tetratricopeptide repeat protein [Acetobacteraceae bacterium]
MRAIFLACALTALAGCAAQPSRPVASNHSVDKVLEAAMQANMPDVALRMASEQVDRNPSDAIALVHQADAYRAMGREAAAEAAYKRALLINPDNMHAQIGMGSVLLHRDPAAAEAAFRSVLTHQPQNPQALTGLGIAQDLRGEHHAAQVSYRAALSARPDLQAARVDLGLSLAVSGQSSEALALLQPAAGDRPMTRQERDDLAVALAAAGRNDEALRILGEEMSDEDAHSTLAAYRQLF